MRRQFIFIAVFMCLALPLRPAVASNCAVDQYDHNGSLMELQLCDGGSLTISYIRPRRGLVPHGVRDGTLLFDGVQQPNGVINGKARIFNNRCGAIAYAIAGTNNQAGSIVLRGSAPVRNRNCQVVRRRSDTLVFTMQGAAAAPGGPQVVAPSCPPGFVLSGGQCVQAAAPTPSCPPGYVFARGQCVIAAAPAPTPSSVGGDWYAVAGSFKSRSQAQARATSLGFGWTVMNTNRCPNFRNGYWIATSGPHSKSEAQAYSGGASMHGAYVKRCH